MLTIDVHLHLAQIPDQVPMWWAKEAHHPFGGVLHSISAKDIIQLLDKTGIDLGIVLGGDFRRTTYHPDYPGRCSLDINCIRCRYRWKDRLWADRVACNRRHGAFGGLFSRVKYRRIYTND